ncbi:hypothetical protein BT93_I0052 [Corymbia citriodora subsp. variegata]|nr:hypothetical protein BT93_I0052 [Corymbia citriodora subsp. variegata]
MVEAALKNAWGPKLIDVRVDDQGFFFFRILDADFRRILLDSGPITVVRVPLILQQWHPLLELKKGSHSKVPVWIKLRNIPFVLWSSRGISGIASVIGNSFYVDQNTEQLKMLSYARVYVELSASDSRQDEVLVQLQGATRRVSVEYEWRSISCFLCGTFGHQCNPPEASSGQPKQVVDTSPKPPKVPPNSTPLVTRTVAPPPIPPSHSSSGGTHAAVPPPAPLPTAASVVSSFIGPTIHLAAPDRCPTVDLPSAPLTSNFGVPKTAAGMSSATHFSPGLATPGLGRTRNQEDSQQPSVVPFQWQVQLGKRASRRKSVPVEQKQDGLSGDSPPTNKGKKKPDHF